MAASRNDLAIISLVCGGAIPVGSPVKIDSSGKAVVATAATDKIIGLSNPTFAYANDEVGDFWVLGISLGKLGAAVSAGEKLTADSNGKLTPATAGNRTVGIALDQGVANDLIPVLINPS